tara:strand:- start:1322 stop:1771 length:450 start_codon:yes stop_codon:yes gene_type:complete
MKSAFILFLIIIESLFESLNPFIKKIILNNNISPKFFYFIVSIFIFLNINIFYFILFLFKKFDYTEIKYVKLSNLKYIILSSFLSMSISFIHIYALKKMNASLVTILEKPLVILLGLIYAKFIFKEHNSVYTYIGAVLIITGTLFTLIK